MTKCMKCGVYIADNTDKCPLCQQVVAPVELSSDNHQGTEGVFEQHNDVPDKCVNDTDSAAKRADSTASHDNGTRYPDVKGASRKYRLLENIILFLSIVGQIVLTTVDYMTDHEINWSFIVLLVVIYANVTLRLAIVGRNGYIFKNCKHICVHGAVSRGHRPAHRSQWLGTYICFPKCHTGDGSCNNYTYDSKHKKLAELHDDAAFSCADERDCDDTCGSQGHMVPISGNGSDGRFAVFVSRNTDYR